MPKDTGKIVLGSRQAEQIKNALNLARNCLIVGHPREQLKEEAITQLRESHQTITRKQNDK